MVSILLKRSGLYYENSLAYIFTRFFVVPLFVGIVIFEEGMAFKDILLSFDENNHI